MSIRLMTKVWDSKAYSGGALLCLLALADFAHDDGSHVFPKVSTLAEKARLNERQVQRCLKLLRDDGVLAIDKAATGRPGVANAYRLDLANLAAIAKMQEPAEVPESTLPSETGDKKTPVDGRHLEQERVTPVSETGDISDNAIKKNRHRTIKEPLGAGALKLGLDVVFPKWWPTKAWDAFVAMRKAIKHPLTPHAIDLAIKRLSDMRAAGQDPETVLNNSTLGSYRGLFEARPGSGSTVVAFEQTSVAGWRGRLDVFFRGGEDTPVGSWSPKWGPKPGEPGCRAPKEAFEPEQRRASS